MWTSSQLLQFKVRIVSWPSSRVDDSIPCSPSSASSISGNLRSWLSFAALRNAPWRSAPFWLRRLSGTGCSRCFYLAFKWFRSRFSNYYKFWILVALFPKKGGDGAFTIPVHNFSQFCERRSKFFTIVNERATHPKKVPSNLRTVKRSVGCPAYPIASLLIAAPLKRITVAPHAHLRPILLPEIINSAGTLQKHTGDQNSGARNAKPENLAFKFS